MEGNFNFSKMPFGEVVKMTIATVTEECNRHNENLLYNNLVEDLRLVIREEVARVLIAARSSEAEGNDEELLFGCFHRNNPVQKCDKRLYTGEHAPFTSKDSVQRFSSKNPGLFVEGENGKLIARAGDIYDALINASVRKIIKGDGIRFNKRRK